MTTMTDSESRKPLGIKNYGHIPHLPGSRLGPGDHKCHEGQERIATRKARDRHDLIIVQEKLDGSNVGVARLGDAIYPLTRAGYLATSSPYEQHWRFAQWAWANVERFLAVLHDGERLVGEWLMQAHGTRYQLTHEPFVAFDLMIDNTRLIYDELKARVGAGDFITPTVIHRGGPCTVEQAMALLGEHGFHGALDPVEGAVWRVERNESTRHNRNERRWVVDFLCKYVRPDKIDGKYLPDVSGQPPVFNWQPG
jgi:hypothetical protein